MSENVKQKKVVKKTVQVGGQKVPMYICPPGMSGLGLDLEKHFNQEDKEEAIFEVIDNSQAAELVLTEDYAFVRAYQKYCDDGEVDNAMVEDFVNYKQINKYYDPESDLNKDLVSIFNN
jgi:hypothetical protein